MNFGAVLSESQVEQVHQAAERPRGRDPRDGEHRYTYDIEMDLGWHRGLELG